MHISESVHFVAYNKFLLVTSSFIFSVRTACLVSNLVFIPVSTYKSFKINKISKRKKTITAVRVNDTNNYTVVKPVLVFNWTTFSII